MYIANRDFERAEDFFERAAKAAPADVRARTRLGVARMAVGDADAGFTELEEASRMDEGGIQADLALVVGHLRRGDAKKALAAQAELERKQPDSALVHNLRGGLMLAKRDIPAARAAWPMPSRTQPGYLAAADNLARLDLAERKPQDAIARIKGVVGNISRLLKPAATTFKNSFCDFSNSSLGVIILYFQIMGENFLFSHGIPPWSGYRARSFFCS